MEAGTESTPDRQPDPADVLPGEYPPDVPAGRRNGDEEETKVAGLPEDAPAELHDAAAGKPVTEKGERRGLKWLLGATRAPEYDVDVEYDTPDGMAMLTFHIRSVDGRRIVALENEHSGDGPFGQLDDIAFNAALAAEGTLFIEDEAGERIEPDSAEFRGAPDIPAALAMEKRFKYQDGLLGGVAGEIRRLGGWEPDRVKRARRSIAGRSGEAASRRLREGEPAAASPAERAVEAAVGNS